MNNKDLIKLPAVKRITTFSSATIYRLMDKGEFPQRIKISERSTAWSLAVSYTHLTLPTICSV